MHTSEKQLYTAVAITAIVLGAIIIVFIITMIRHQRKFLQFHKLKIKSEISALENERKRIATDIHDELGPILSAVRMQVNMIQADSAKDRNIIAFANKHIDNILNKTREISYNLLPVTLERNGICYALKDLVRRNAKTYGIHITLDCNEEIIIPKEMEVNIYRIFQEIIHNTIKHAKAEKLALQLIREHNRLFIRTADNGIGFNYYKHIHENKGLGLLGLQSRADILDAVIEIETSEGEGTKYFIEIPVK